MAYPCFFWLYWAAYARIGAFFASAAAGIGLRPIGLVYLIYPVFYTNVSGIEKVGLNERVLVDCGGFVFTECSCFFFAVVFGRERRFAEAARWIAVIILLILIRFSDRRLLALQRRASEFKTVALARAAVFLSGGVHRVFAYFSGGRCRVGNVWAGLNMLIHLPEYCRRLPIVLGAYFVFVGLAGGLRRFQEGHQEWRELSRFRAENNSRISQVLKSGIVRRKK